MHKSFILCWIAFFAQIGAANGQFHQFTSQASIDNNIWYEEYNYLIIGSDTCCSDINDLSALFPVRRVRSKLIIQNCPNLKSLHGLENLRSAQFGVEILNNDSLTNLVGLASSLSNDNPDDPQGIVTVAYNDNLVDLTGFPRTPNGTINITHNNNLQSLKGIKEVRNLQVTYCPNFQEFALDSVENIKYCLRVGFCPRLKSFSGLTNLKRLGGKALFHNLDSLQSTAGTKALKIVGGISFANCPQLKKFEDWNLLKGQSGSLNFSYCHQMNDFSGLSDSTWFYQFNFHHADSVQTFIDLHHVQAQEIYMSFLPNLRTIESIPTDKFFIPFYDNSGILTRNIFELFECPKLEYIHHPDNLPSSKVWGRIEVFCKGGDLSAFNRVDSVLNYISVGILEADTVVGFSNLKYCGDFRFRGRNVKKIDAFNQLTTVKNGFGIGGLGMDSLGGFVNLKEVGALYISFDSSLISLSPFQDIGFDIKYGIWIDNLLEIEEISGFNNSMAIGLPGGTYNEHAGVVRINEMPKLKIISGFNGLDSVRYRFDLTSENFMIENNPELETIAGFKNLIYTDGTFVLRNNPNLTNVQGFCKLFKSGYTGVTPKIIQDNGQGANSVFQIRLGCDTLSSTKEIVNSDINIYPNPASNMVTFEFDDSDWKQIEIISSIGIVVNRKINDNKVKTLQIDISNLPSGLYFIKTSYQNSIKISEQRLAVHAAP